MQDKLRIQLPINNSTLGTIKRYFTNTPPFNGGEFYLKFGGEFHSRVLENKSKENLDEESIKLIQAMTKSLHKNPVFKKAMSGSPILEKLRFNEVNGVPMRGTLDILNRNCAYDLKTTSEETFDKFVKKAIKLDYFRQSYVYKQLAEVDNFIFIGVCKKPPYNIYILNTNDYETQEEIQKNEAHFLLEVAKTICNIRSAQDRKQKSRRS